MNMHTLQCYMVTGDNWTTARAIANRLGIVNVMAEVQPDGKAEQVRGAGRHGWGTGEPAVCDHMHLLIFKHASAFAGAWVCLQGIPEV